MEFDLKRFNTLDRVIAGAAAIAFIALFLPWYGASIGPFSASASGWSAGFSAWAGGLLLTAAGVLVVLRRSGASTSAGRIGPSSVVLGVAGLGLLLVIIRWVSFPRYHASGITYNVGARYGIYVALLAGIAEVLAAVMEMRASGEAAPWAQGEHEPEPAEPPAPEAQAASERPAAPEDSP